MQPGAGTQQTKKPRRRGGKRRNARGPTPAQLDRFTSTALAAAEEARARAPRPDGPSGLDETERAEVRDIARRAAIEAYHAHKAAMADEKQAGRTAGTEGGRQETSQGRIGDGQKGGEKEPDAQASANSAGEPGNTGAPAPPGGVRGTLLPPPPRAPADEESFRTGRHADSQSAAAINLNAPPPPAGSKLHDPAKSDSAALSASANPAGGTRVPASEGNPAVPPTHDSTTARAATSSLPTWPAASSGAPSTSSAPAPVPPPRPDAAATGARPGVAATTPATTGCTDTTTTTPARPPARAEQRAATPFPPSKDDAGDPFDALIARLVTIESQITPSRAAPIRAAQATGTAPAVPTPDSAPPPPPSPFVPRTHAAVSFNVRDPPTPPPAGSVPPAPSTFGNKAASAVAHTGAAKQVSAGNAPTSAPAPSSSSNEQPPRHS